MLRGMQHTNPLPIELTKIQSDIQLTGNIKQIKSLPPEQSIIPITVLEKENSLLTILVQGLRFKTQLPFQVKAGDIFFARVLSLEPFVLSAHQLAQLGKKSPLSLILNLLHVAESSPAVPFIERLLSENKPLLTGKISEFLRFIEGMETVPDMYLVGLMHQLYVRPEETYKDFLKRKSSFRETLTELIKKICDAVSEWHEKEPGGKLFPLLHDTVLIAAGAVPASFLSFEDRDAQLLEVIHMLGGGIAAGNAFPHAVPIIEKICMLLVKFLLLKSMYIRYDLFPDFIIVKKSGKFSIIYCNSYRTTDGKGDTTYALNASFEDEENGAIVVKGLVYYDKLFAEVLFSNDTLRNTYKVTDELKAMISGSFRITPHITVKSYTPDQLSGSLIRTSIDGKV